ncbi:MAG: S8 family serine peptidase [Verrucomicrobiota bacterium]
MLACSSGGLLASESGKFTLSPGGKEIVRGELLVKFRDSGVTGFAEDEVGAQTVKSLRGYKTFPRTKLVRFGEDAELEKAMEALKRSGSVEAISYNYVRRASATAANDPLFDNLSQWGLKNEGQLGGVAGADINAAEGWDTIKTAPSIVVAVIDSGIRHSHEDLAGNMWVNANEIPGNGIDDDNNGYIDDVHGINAIDGSGDSNDDHGHGTHVAGILGAVGDNGVGVAGLVWDVQLMSLKFLDENGDGTDADAIECIDYARSMGADIINNSWGGSGFNAVMRSKIAEAGDDGIIFVAAAGNESSNIDDSKSYPASYDLPSIVSVTATNRKDEMPGFANFGEDSVDIAAPGVAIYSTYYGSDSDYRILSGTSMATPFVSGTLACLKELYPSDSTEDLLSRLYASVDVLPGLARRCRTGGRLNFARSLAAYLEARPINDDFSMATLVASTQVQTSGVNLSATTEVGEPAHDANESGKSVWWKWVAPLSGEAEVSSAGSDFFTVLAVYEGVALNSLSLIGKAIEPSSSLATLRGASVKFAAVEGEEYYFAVDGLLGDEGNVSLSIGQAVENDSFADRILLEGIDFVATANNASATAEVGEPNHAGGVPSRSLWWEWESPVTGYVTFTTASTNSLDTLMGIYEGASVGELVELYADDDSGPGWSSEIAEAFVIQGGRYVIAIDGWNGGFGDIALAITHGENDLLRNARSFVGDEFSDMAFNSRATKETSEPDHGGNEGGRSLWWEWTATTGGNASVSTLGSDFDTLLGVYRGNEVGDLVEIGQSDDDGGSNTSLVLFEAEAGETYLIAVDGFKGNFGHDFGVVRVEGAIFADGTSLAPVIGDPGLLSGTVGASMSFSLPTTNIVDSFAADGLPGGLNLDTATGEISGVATTAGLFVVEFTATNDQGTGVRLVTIDIAASGASPGAAFVLSERFGASGERMVLAAEISNAEGASYQWKRNGAAISGATGTTYEIVSLDEASVGRYSVMVETGSGAAESNTQHIQISDTRISNSTVLGRVDLEGGPLRAEFEIGGTSPRQVLVQGLGPSLWRSGREAVLIDPVMILRNEAAEETVFDNWRDESNAAEIVSVGQILGASSLAADKDAAFLRVLDPGSYAIELSGRDGGEGLAMLEIFYADTEESQETRLKSVSKRIWVSGVGERGLETFVIDGTQPQRVLLRAVGPSLSVEQGVTVLADPFIKLYRGRELINLNDDWGVGDVEMLEAVSRLLGGAALESGSYDSALYLELDPGVYTVIIEGVAGAEGACRFELFEVN